MVPGLVIAGAARTLVVMAASGKTRQGRKEISAFLIEPVAACPGPTRERTRRIEVSGFERNDMQAKLLSEIEGRREWALIFEAGDEVMEELRRFAQAERLSAAHFTGIGAFSKATVAWFDLESQSYKPIELAEQVEVISLLGDVAEDKGKPAVHAHLCVAKRDGTAHGGHLQKAFVLPTLEVILIESPAHLRKIYRPEFGLALIDLDRSQKP